MKLSEVTKKDLCFKIDKDITMSDSDSRKFRGVAYSGQMIKDHPYWGNLIFDISSMTYEKKIPVLFNHDPNRIVGSGTLEKLDQLILNGVFSKTTPDGIQLFDLIKNEEFPMQESVFIEPEVEFLKKGKAFVNGVEVSAPVTIFRNGKIREVSLTPLGADGNTSTQVFNLQTIKIKEKKMDKNFEKFCEVLEQSQEEAFKFACGCNEKASAPDAEALKIENEELKAKLEAAMQELAELKNTKASEIRDSKVRRIKDVFSKFSSEASEDLIDVLLTTPDNKFDSTIAAIELNFKKISTEKTNSDLTKKTEITIKPEGDESLKKIQMKASELRDSKGLTVPDSYAEARKILGLN